jgi:hypothetical protein
MSHRFSVRTSVSISDESAMDSDISTMLVTVDVGMAALYE